MSTDTSAAKPYKGIGMEGMVARWYAGLTSRSMDRFKALADRIHQELPADSRILEVAPGPGYLAIELARFGAYEVTGLDISHTFVDLARANAAKANVQVDFRHGDASHMPFPDESFEFIVCTAAFKNFTRPIPALREMYRVLKPSGRALIVDLRRDASTKSISQAVHQMNVGAVNSLITRLTFRFMLLRRAYTKAEFEHLARQTPFQSVEIQEDLIGMEVSLTRAPVTPPDQQNPDA